MDRNAPERRSGSSFFNNYYFFHYEICCRLDERTTKRYPQTFRTLFASEEGRYDGVRLKRGERTQLRRLWGDEWTGYGFRCSASSACGRRQDDREGGRDGGKREGEFLISKFLRDYLKLALTQSDASTLERESEGERRQPASTQPAKITLIL